MMSNAAEIKQSPKIFRDYKIYNIELIKNFEHNSRTHSEEQIQDLVRSINEFGFTNPLLIDENDVLIAGHCRLEAAKRVGYEKLPCVIIDNLTEVQKAALVIADNKMALNASWDFSKLSEQITFLKDNDYDLDLTGFKADEIATFMPDIVPEFMGDEDDVPAPPAEPITKLGDVWILGQHRLLCGDSTMIDDVEKLTQYYFAKLMVTDPPYGVNYDPDWRNNANLGVGDRSVGKVENDDVADWTDAYSLFNGDIVYIWHAGKFTHVVAQNLINCGFDIISQIIWAKNNFAISRGDYHWKHEPCWYAVKKGQKHNWQGQRDQSTLWEINNTHQNNENEKVGHGTQKPVECMERPILNNSTTGDFIYDPFGGSGTTLIACEKHQRNCLMMELSPNYCDVIVKRWETFTGKKAELEANNGSGS